jgi:hypothetical protein
MWPINRLSGKVKPNGLQSHVFGKRSGVCSFQSSQRKIVFMFAPRSLFGFALITVLGLQSYRSLAAQQQTPEVASSAYAELDDASARKLVKGCSLPHEVSGPGAAGSQIVLQFTVSEKGKLLTVHSVQGALTHQLSAGFASCHFASYKVNGTPTPFHANIIIDVK